MNRIFRGFEITSIWERPVIYFNMPDKHCETTTRQLLKLVEEVQMYDTDLQSERIAEIVDLNNLCTHCVKTLRKLKNKSIGILLLPLDLQFVRQLLKGLEIPDEIIVEIVVHAPRGSLNCDAFKIRQALETEGKCDPKEILRWTSVLSAKKR